jgi:hypothetical protein
MKLASSFARGSTSVRSSTPLSDDQIRNVAPSIYADSAHESRSQRYAYIPTNVILDGLRKEGFQPFAVTQSRVRDENKRDHAKHMIRLRHASMISAGEANEIILLNSHDGTSSYQMLAGQFVFVCSNGLVSGTAENDIRIRHQGKVQDDVIEGAFRVLEDFEQIGHQRDAMKSLSLNEGERQAFAHAALELRYGDPDGALMNAPITEQRVLTPRRFDERGKDLWTTFNVVQENVIRGDQQGRNANGRRTRTRPITGIDQDVKLNRALWVLAEEMRKLKAV